MKRASTTRLIARLDDVWNEVHRYNRKSYATISSETPCFIDYAWQQFDAKTVLEILIADRTTYRAQKPILFAGLCAWMISPNDLAHCKHAMLLVAIEHMKRAEALGRGEYEKHDAPNGSILGDIFGRLRWLGDGFYEDFYYPVGGLSAIVSCISTAELVRQRKERENDVKIAIEMMRIFDHHAKFLFDRDLYYQASEAKAYVLLRAIFGLKHYKFGIDIGKYDRVWKQLRSVSALLYAASKIQNNRGEILLDKILSGSATYEADKSCITVLIARARYICKEILSKTTIKHLGDTNLTALPQSFPTEIDGLTPTPIFNSADVEVINAEFDIRAILGARRPGKLRTRVTRRGPRME